MKTEMVDSVIVEKDKTISDLEEIIVNNFREKYGIDLIIDVNFLFYFPDISLTASVGEELPQLFTVNYDAFTKEITIETFVSDPLIDNIHNLEEFKEKYLEYLESDSLKRLMSLYLGYI